MQTLLEKIQNCKFGQNITAPDCNLPKGFKGLIIGTRANGNFYAAWGYGYYGLLSCHRDFQTFEALQKFLSDNGINEEIFGAEYDPSLFNGM